MSRMAQQRAILKTIFLASAFLCETFFLSAQSKAPGWVNDVKKVYPENAWISAVESRPSRQEAQAAAVGALATTFKVDVKSVNSAQKTMSSENNKFSQSSAIKSQTDTNSNVSGLMGVVYDTYEAPDHTWHACARMNRKDGGALYSSVINENDKNIKTLMRQAADNPATFEAYEALNFAYNIAILTDNYMNILSVLNSDARQAIKLSYGNANAVRTLAMKEASSIVIDIDGTVSMSQDIAGLQSLDAERIDKSFQEVFTKRKFKTVIGQDDAAYTLTFDLTIDKVDLKGNTNKFARYVLKAALTDQWGEEILSFSETDRSGHTSMNEAVQRAIRDVETCITETGFAATFDEYLASLLE